MDDIIAASGPVDSRVCMYDIRLYGVDFPPGRDDIVDYLNRADVRAAIHSADTPGKYIECANPPYDHLSKVSTSNAVWRTMTASTSEC
jgi:hypothetical protein